MAAAAGLAVAAGCGDGPASAPEAVVHEWVAAVNADDYGRACALTAWEGGNCERGLSRAITTRLEVGRIRRDGDRARAELMPVAPKDPAPGWTAYAPLELEVAVEPDGGEHRVHLNAAAVE